MNLGSIQRAVILFTWTLISVGSGVSQARDSLPRCSQEESIPGRTCHDLGNQGTLCIKQYQPYSKSGRPLNLCRYQVTLSKPDPDGKARILFSRAYSKKGKTLIRQARSFVSRTSQDPPKTLVFSNGIDKKGKLLRPGKPPWISRQVLSSKPRTSLSSQSKPSSVQKKAPCAGCTEDVWKTLSRNQPVKPNSIQQIERLKSVVDQSTSQDALVDRFFRATNERRMKRGLPPLLRFRDLDAEAQKQCNLLAGKVSQGLIPEVDFKVHLDASNSAPINRDICRRTKCRVAGENVVFLYDEGKDDLPEKALYHLMTSQGHRSNILGRTDDRGDLSRKAPTMADIDRYPLYDNKAILIDSSDGQSEIRPYNQIGVARCQVRCAPGDRCLNRSGTSVKGQWIYTQFFVERPI